MSLISIVHDSFSVTSILGLLAHHEPPTSLHATVITTDQLVHESREYEAIPVGIILSM
jgi:hypothetical protein